MAFLVHRWERGARVDAGSLIGRSVWHFGKEIPGKSGFLALGRCPASSPTRARSREEERMPLMCGPRSSAAGKEGARQSVKEKREGEECARACLATRRLGRGERVWAAEKEGKGGENLGLRARSRWGKVFPFLLFCCSFFSLFISKSFQSSFQIHLKIF